MISIIGLAAVVALVLWILFRWRSRSELLLLIPFVVVSNFFGFLPYGMFSREGTFQQSDVAFALVLLVCIFFVNKRRQTIRISAFHRVYRNIAIFFLIFLVLDLFVSFAQYGSLVESVKVFRYYFGYSSILFFFYAISRLTASQIERLLVLIENLTIILSFLYVVNFGFGVPIFGIESYRVFSFGGQELFRNFLAIPIFLLFSLARFLLKPRFSVRTIVGIVLILVTYMLTYTRNALVGVLVVVALASAVWFVLYRNKARRVAFLGITTLVLGLTAVNIFSEQTDYFISRLTDVQRIGGIQSVPSFMLRQEIILSRIDLVLATNPVTGLGFIRGGGAGQYYPGIFVRPGDEPGSVVVGDQSWGNAIANIGFGGAFLLLLLFIYPIYYMLKTKSLLNQNSNVYGALIVLFVEFFVFAFFGGFLLTDVLQICFYCSIVYFFMKTDKSKVRDSGLSDIEGQWKYPESI